MVPWIFISLLVDMKATPLLMSIVILLLLVWAWFFSVTEAQYYGYNWYSSQSQSLEHIYRVNDALNNIPFVAQHVQPLISFNQSDLLQHAASQDISTGTGIAAFFAFPHDSIVRFLNESITFDAFYQKMRISFVQFLMDKRYTSFNTQPYAHEGNNAIILNSWDFNIVKNIAKKDNLDVLLEQKLSLFQSGFDQLKKFGTYLDFTDINITSQEYQNLWTVFLFKNQQDLSDLWYTLVSRRSRINNDPEYRRYNIKTAFNNIGNVRLIMPNEIFSVTHEYSAYESAPFMRGYATIGATIQLVYGWWICGVATAFYQGVLTNMALAIHKMRAHSIYYKSFYNATIDGTFVSDPWLDATLYMKIVDFKVQNIREYPVVIVLNFDWTPWGNEDAFTLSRSQDKGSFSYIGKTSSHCYQRKVNGELRTSCYNKIQK